MQKTTLFPVFFVHPSLIVFLFKYIRKFICINFQDTDIFRHSFTSEATATSWGFFVTRRDERTDGEELDILVVGFEISLTPDDFE